jgi:hypothetical protein
MNDIMTSDNANYRSIETEILRLLDDRKTGLLAIKTRQRKRNREFSEGEL